MTAWTKTRLDTRMLRHWLAGGWQHLVSVASTARAEAELRAMDERELRDLGLDRGGIGYAARDGRDQA